MISFSAVVSQARERALEAVFRKGFMTEEALKLYLEFLGILLTILPYPPTPQLGIVVWE